MQKWEYLVVSGDYDRHGFHKVSADKEPYKTRFESFKVEYGKHDDMEYLDLLGEDGWELVTDVMESDSDYWRLIFKRPKA